MDAELKKRVRKARKNFIAIIISYFMGLFNDNFYKEAALFIAVSQNNITIQAFAAGIFTLCYMLAAAPAGWLSDKYSKGYVIIAAKGAEVIAMIAGAIGIWTGNWYMVLAMIGIMGAQSAVFSPAMNGSIPEIYPEEYVQTANTAVKIISTAGIFLGMALAGYIIDIRFPEYFGIPAGVFLVGVFVLIAAFIGFFVSFYSPRVKPQKTAMTFPWTGPAESIKELIKVQRVHKKLAVCVWGNIFIWSVAAVMTLLMVNMGIDQFRFSAKMTAFTKIIFLIGIAIGGFLSNFIAKGEKLFKVFIPTFYIMGGLLLMIGALPYFLTPPLLPYAVIILIALSGVAGGIDLVPFESFIQIYPPANEKGRVIAAANFGVFAGMSLGAALLYVLNKNFIATTSLGVLGVITFVFTFFLSVFLKKTVGKNKF